MLSRLANYAMFREGKLRVVGITFHLGQTPHLLSEDWYRQGHCNRRQNPCLIRSKSFVNLGSEPISRAECMEY